MRKVRPLLLVAIPAAAVLAAAVAFVLVFTSGDASAGPLGPAGNQDVQCMPAFPPPSDHNGYLPDTRQRWYRFGSRLSAPR